MDTGDETAEVCHHQEYPQRTDKRQQLLRVLRRYVGDGILNSRHDTFKGGLQPPGESWMRRLNNQAHTHVNSRITQVVSTVQVSVTGPSSKSGAASSSTSFMIILPEQQLNVDTPDQ